MATGSLYGSVSESTGLYGIGAASGGTYFEWFIFYDATTAPATPTGGSWSFTTNTGTAPTGWLNAPPAAPTNLIWVSIAVVDSRSTSTLSWSAPGLMTGSGLPVLTASGVPASGTGVNGQFYVNTATTPQSMYLKEAGSWVQLTGSNLVDLVSNQTIGGTKTFSSPIVGSVTGTAANVTGTVAIANGGTGATTASAARTALGLGTISTQDASNVAITGGSISLTTALPIASGGTGAITAAAARTNLSVVGVTDTQTLTNKTISGASNTLTNIGNSSLSNSTVTVNGSAIALGSAATITASTPQNLVFGSGLSASGNFNGSTATTVTLANAGTAGTYGNSNVIPVFTTNAFGQVTAVTPVTLTLDSTDITGTIAIAQGGTGAGTASAALVNLLPSYSGNAGKILALNAGGSNVEWRAVSGTGTVSSVDVSGGTTGLTTSGGPITAAGTITLAGTLAVANGGTGVTASSGANSVVLRDASANISANSISEGYSNVAAAGTTTVLTVASVPNYVVTGSGGQTYQLPNATTLSNGANYVFNNNQSSGTIVVKNNSSTTIATIQSGGYVEVVLLSNATAAGSWDVHNQAPSNVSWSTNTFDYPGSITSATWNGATVATNRGGTGLTSFTANGVVYASSTSALTTGTALTFDGTNLAATSATTSFTMGNTTGFGTITGAGTNGGSITFSGATRATYPSAIQYAGTTQIWYNESLGSEYMRLTSTGLGIGTTSPAYKLDVTGGARVTSNVGIGSNYDAAVRLYVTGSDNTSANIAALIVRADGQQIANFRNDHFVTLGNGAFKLDTSGNLGLGVTPSTGWSAPAKAFQISGTGSIAGYGSNEIDVSTNIYYSGGYKYLTGAAAASYQQNAGQHQWYNAPSGTAGTAITFTQAATLDASGNFLVGTTSTTGSASNNKIVAGGRFRTVSGSVSAATATATTLFTAPTDLGAWLVTVNVDADSTLYAATYIVNTQGGSSTVATLLYKGSLISVSVSGYNVQATQTSGGTATIQYSAVRIA